MILLATPRTLMRVAILMNLDQGCKMLGGIYTIDSVTLAITFLNVRTTLKWPLVLTHANF